MLVDSPVRGLKVVDNFSSVQTDVVDWEFFHAYISAFIPENELERIQSLANAGNPLAIRDHREWAAFVVITESLDGGSLLSQIVTNAWTTFGWNDNGDPESIQHVILTPEESRNVNGFMTDLSERGINWQDDPNAISKAAPDGYVFATRKTQRIDASGNPVEHTEIMLNGVLEYFGPHNDGITRKPQKVSNFLQDLERSDEGTWARNRWELFGLVATKLGIDEHNSNVSFGFAPALPLFMVSTGEISDRLIEDHGGKMCASIVPEYQTRMPIIMAGLGLESR